MGHTVHIGILVLGSALQGCARISNFNIYRTHGFGVYFNNDDSLQLWDTNLVDNRVGLFPFISRDREELYIEIYRSNFIGQSDDCTHDNGNKHAAIILTTFQRGGNFAPFLGWTGLFQFPSAHGITTIDSELFDCLQLLCTGSLTKSAVHCVAVYQGLHYTHTC